MALAKRFAPEFGIKNPERDLAEIKKTKSNDGRLTVRYQQKYQGIPVIGGELIVNTNEGWGFVFDEWRSLAQAFASDSAEN